MGLDHFGVGWRANNSSEELRRIAKGEKCSLILIEDALEIASYCRDVFDGNIFYNELEKMKVYSDVFFGDLSNSSGVVLARELAYRENIMLDAVYVTSSISRGEMPSLKSIEGAVEFFDMLTEGCLGRV